MFSDLMRLSKKCNGPTNPLESTCVYEGTAPAGGENDKNSVRTPFKVPESLNQEEVGNGW